MERFSDGKLVNMKQYKFVEQQKELNSESIEKLTLYVFSVKGFPCAVINNNNISFRNKHSYVWETEFTGNQQYPVLLEGLFKGLSEFYNITTNKMCREVTIIMNNEKIVEWLNGRKCQKYGQEIEECFSLMEAIAMRGTQIFIQFAHSKDNISKGNCVAKANSLAKQLKDKQPKSQPVAWSPKVSRLSFNKAVNDERF